MHIPGSALYQYKLCSKCISPAADIVSCPEFEVGVAKIQKGVSDELTEEEKSVVSSLRYSVQNNTSFIDNTGCSATMGMKERKTDIAQHNYMDCNYIERVFSLAKYVLPVNRRSMTQQLFQVIALLKVNGRF